MNPRLLPTLGALGIVVLVLLPFVGLLSALVTDPGDPLTGASLSWTDTVAQAGATRLLFNSVGLAVAVALGSVAIGGWLAWVEQRVQMPGHRFLMLMALLPMAMPSYISAGTVRAALSPGGWIGDALGLPHMTGFALAILVLIAVTSPLVQLVVGAALRQSSAAEEEAARTLGAPSVVVFRAVVWPRLRAAVGFGALLSLLYAISDFGAVAVLDCPVLTWRLYDAVRGQEVARAAVLGVAVLAATIPLFALARWVRGGTVRAGVANPREVPRMELGIWGKLFTGISLLLVVGIGLLIPVVTLIGWVVDGVSRDLQFADALTPVLHTLGAAFFGALLTLAVAWLPAWAVAKRQRSGGQSGWLEDAIAFTSALPGVLLALGLIQVALVAERQLGFKGLYMGALSGGILLGLGYATRFVAEVFAPLRVGFLLYDPRLDESARVLGASRWDRWRRIKGPAIGPAVAVAFVIGFNAIVKELPVTLLLGGATGLRTLSFRVWDRYGESLWHDAGLAGLLLVSLALVSVIATLRWRQNG